MVGVTKTSLQNPAKKGPQSNKVIKKTFLPRLSGKDIRSEINSIITDGARWVANGPRPRASCPVSRGAGGKGLLASPPSSRAPGEHGAHLHFPPALGGLCVVQRVTTESGDTGKQRGEKAGLMRLTFLDNCGGQAFVPCEINVPWWVSGVP